MKKTFNLIQLTMLLILLSGCWNLREFSELSIVLAVGIDQNEYDEYILSFQILNADNAQSSAGSQDSSSDEAVWVLTSKGDTIFEAVRNAATHSSRKLYFPHNKIYVINEDVAKKGLHKVMDFFVRDPEGRRIAYMFITKNKASDIINAKHKQETIPAIAIEGLVQLTYATSKTPKVTLHDFRKAFTNETNQPYIPGIVLKEESEDKNTFYLQHTAVFDKDMLVGWLDDEETKGLLYIFIDYV